MLQHPTIRQLQVKLQTDGRWKQSRLTEYVSQYLNMVRYQEHHIAIIKAKPPSKLLEITIYEMFRRIFRSNRFDFCFVGNLHYGSISKAICIALFPQPRVTCKSPSRKQRKILGSFYFHIIWRSMRVYDLNDNQAGVQNFN